MLRVFASLFLAVALASAAPIVTVPDLDTSHLSEEFFQEWSVLGRAEAEHVVLLSFAVRLDGVELLEKKFASVSDPKNADYANYWTHEQLHNTVYPNADALKAVTTWLESAGVEFQVERGFVRAKVAASLAESLLSVKLFHFQHLRRSDVTVTRSATPAVLPAAVAPYIDFVGGLVSFPVLRHLTEHNVEKAPKIKPDNLRSLYAIDEEGSGETWAAQALAEFQHQAYSKGDLEEFQKMFHLTPQAIRNVTGKIGVLGHTEANLDVQYIMVTGEKIPTDFWLVEGFSFDLIGWITAVQKNKTADVWSVSYGEDISTVTVDYATRLDKEFQQIAVLGASVIFASGDSGVYSRSGGTAKFHPSFPASLPSVTAVGATQLDDDGVERNCTTWSGGGFSLSSYFTRPSYQDNAVKAYTASGYLPSSDLWDSAGRGFPDVSAVGVNYEVVVDRIPMGVSGTSAAAPAFAGVIALLNDIRIKAGKPQLGFLNPWIYQNPDMFHDIVMGCNNNDVKDAQGNPAGFCARAGWDPATGMGTPNYPKLKAAALAA